MVVADEAVSLGVPGERAAGVPVERPALFLQFAHDFTVFYSLSHPPNTSDQPLSKPNNFCAEARNLGYVTISDAGRDFGIHRGHLYYYAKKHKLKTLKIGGQVFYDKKQLYKILKEEYVSDQSNTPETGTPKR